jgi:plasmid maintenance system antidote protein VapI
VRSRSARSRGRAEVERLIQVVEAARREKDISQRALARALGLHEMTVMRFVNGERTLDVLEFIDVCRELGKDPCEMLRLVLEVRNSGSEAS